MSSLRGMTWSHRRGLAPLLHATERYGVAIDWDARSLREFEDTPVAELAARYDLVAIDHPFMGQAAATGAFRALDELLPADVLAEQAAGSVGPSFRSYTWAGHQWALPMDAAAQVSAYRPDLVDAAPASWAEAEELLRALPAGTVGKLPANPTHLWASFLTLCHHEAGPSRTEVGVQGRPVWWPADGIVPDVAAAAAAALYRLLALVDPGSLAQDPIQVLDEMAAGAPVAYAPLVFGYSNYARDGYGARLVRFADAPGPDGTPAGTMLGGVGLAVSAACADPAAAARFAASVVAPDFQADGYAHAGGQPGHRRAWTDPVVNELTHGFFADTLATLDASFVRGRDTGYPAYQSDAGELLHELVRRRESPAAIVTALTERWRRT
ncbi:MAG TPA: extracellular solute-binding protein [Actinocatenispora sp.]